MCDSRQGAKRLAKVFSLLFLFTVICVLKLSSFFTFPPLLGLDNDSRVLSKFFAEFLVEPPPDVEHCLGAHPSALPSASRSSAEKGGAAIAGGTGGRGGATASPSGSATRPLSEPRVAALPERLKHDARFVFRRS